MVVKEAGVAPSLTAMLTAPYAAWALSLTVVAATVAGAAAASPGSPAAAVAMVLSPLVGPLAHVAAGQRDGQPPDQEVDHPTAQDPDPRHPGRPVDGRSPVPGRGQGRA